MCSLTGELWGEAVYDGVTQQVEADQRGGNREDAVPLKRGVDEVEAEGGDADPEQVLPLITEHAPGTRAACCNRIRNDCHDEEGEVDHPERRVEGAEPRVQCDEEILPGPLRHCVTSCFS